MTQQEVRAVLGDWYAGELRDDRAKRVNPNISQQDLQKMCESVTRASIDAALSVGPKPTLDEIREKVEKREQDTPDTESILPDTETRRFYPELDWTLGFNWAGLPRWSDPYGYTWKFTETEDGHYYTRLPKKGEPVTTTNQKEKTMTSKLLFGTAIGTFIAHYWHIVAGSALTTISTLTAIAAFFFDRAVETPVPTFGVVCVILGILHMKGGSIRRNLLKWLNIQERK